MILSEGAAAASKCASTMNHDEQNERKVEELNGRNGCDRDEPPRNAYNHGGRLKFFKDGKFILELERAREGERVSWVSVPRKTFWPPQGNASAPSFRQESCTSLSVSDDNSSIQSSPWQRDHSWKQTNPRRNVSKELCFHYRRPKKLHFTRSRKRRRPYEVTTESKNTSRTAVKVCNKKRSLLSVVQSLFERVTGGSSPRAEAVVSPRKRFLREMGTPQSEDACLKRIRGRPVKAVGSPIRANGTTDESRPARSSSYSITSLLADDRNVKKSPINSPSHFSPAPTAQYCSPDDRLYTESVDRLRSIELSHPDKRLYPPYAAAAAAAAAYMPHFYPFPILPQYYFPAVNSVYPASLNPRTEPPPCTWNSTQQPSNNTEHRDDNIADMPLNLSKHGA